MDIIKLNKAISDISDFMNMHQMRNLKTGALDGGEEDSFFQEKIFEIQETINNMPVTYEQDGLGDNAIAHLHYFYAGSDWYITEKDMDGGVLQAFGFVRLNNDNSSAELGYISIMELTELNEVELDFTFTPQPLSEIKAGMGLESISQSM